MSGFTTPMDTRHPVHPGPARCFPLRRRSCFDYVSRQHCPGERKFGRSDDNPQGLFVEMFFTLLLAFVVLMLAIEKSEAIFLAPIGIGLVLFVSTIAGVFT